MNKKCKPRPIPSSSGKAPSASIRACCKAAPAALLCHPRTTCVPAQPERQPTPTASPAIHSANIPTLDLVQDNPPPSMPKPAKRHHTDQTRQEHRRQKCHKPMGSVPCKNGPGAGVAYQCPAPAIAALLSAPLPSPISRETKRQKETHAKSAML